MYSNFLTDYCFFGGGADRFFGDAVLCVGILYFCEFDDINFRIFAVGDVDGVCSGKCTRALSDEGDSDGFGINDGEEGKVCVEVGFFDDCSCDNVGGGDVAVDFV